MEIVTANGEIVQTSRKENEDLFWAARGSGQGFFGVVTRVWGRTIPMRRLWETVAVFDCTHRFAEILNALLEITDRTPKDGVEVAFATFRPDRDEPGLGEEVQDSRVFIAATALAFADTFDKAADLLSVWANLPDILVQDQIMKTPVVERTWNELFEAQDKLNPAGNGERWQCDSILDRPGVPREEVGFVAPSILVRSSRVLTCSTVDRSNQTGAHGSSHPSLDRLYLRRRLRPR
jgi:hypothetical protein